MAEDTGGTPDTTGAPDTRPEYEIAREQLTQRMRELQVEIRDTFVPWTRSRDFTPEVLPAWKRTLNWRVSVWIAGRHVHDTDYSAGSGHCPCRTVKKLGPWGGNTADRGAE